MAGNVIFNCNRCESVVKRTTLPRGNLKPKFMFVGDAPGVGDGEKEGIDRAWSYGPSSRLLIEALQIVGIYEKCWFTNQLKCACPENRPSLTGEQDNCRHYLEAEMERLKPKRVVLLGKHVQQSFHTIEGVKYYELCHPSYYVRMGKKATEYAELVERILA